MRKNLRRVARRSRGWKQGKEAESEHLLGRAGEGMSSKQAWRTADHPRFSSQKGIWMLFICFGKRNRQALEHVFAGCQNQYALGRGENTVYGQP